MTRMTQDEKQRFLAGLHVGMLGLNEEGRGPLVVPIWYSYEVGGLISVITGESSRKGRLLTVGARVGFAVQTEMAPYTYVSVEGGVSVVEPTQFAELEAMAIRYLGDDQGQAYAAGSGLDGSVTVRIQPERWLAVDYNKL